VATIQLDRQQPERFDLTFTNEQGEKERAVMIHAAIAGSLERFTAVLIEHLAGNFPLWLAPEQIAVIPVAEAHNEYAQGVHEQLMAAGFRSQINTDNDSMGKKVRNAKQGKLPYFLIIGDTDIANKTVTVESRDTGESVAMTVDDLLVKLADEATV
jgi:threonyl-tRNA synthetase